MDKITEFKLKNTPYIALCDLLKSMNLCENGGAAKHAISAGLVKVDGVIELRKRAKIVKDQIVEFELTTIKIV